MNSTQSATHETISQRAHQIWEQTGKPAGSELDHWLQAERELHQGEGKRNGTGGARGNSVEPAPKHVSQTPPHSTAYAPSGVTTDSLHHRRKG